jgi:sec-independent protein translocase protein TatA
MGLSWSHILIALSVFALLFGTGKISALMGDVAKGIKSFRQGLTEECGYEAKPEVKVVDYQDIRPRRRAELKVWPEAEPRGLLNSAWPKSRSCSTSAGLSSWLSPSS